MPKRAIRQAESNPPGLGLFAQRVAEADDLEALSRLLLEILQQVSRLDSVFLTEIDWNTEEQRVLFARNAADGNVREGQRTPWRDTLCRRALDDNVQIAADAPRHWPDAQVAAASGIRTYVGVPVRTQGDRIIGTLCGTSRKTRDVSTHVRDLMVLFGDLLGRQIERERAATADRQRVAAAERSATLFAALAEIGRICSQAETIEPALRDCASVLQHAYSEATVHALTEAVDDGSAPIGHAAPAALMPWVRQRFAAAALPGGAAWFERSETAWRDHDLDALLGPSIQTLGVACAVHGDRVQAALLVGSTSPDHHGDTMPEVMRGIALHLSLLVTRVHVSTDIQHAYRELERQSLTDPLTGLPNRRGLDRAVERFGRGPDPAERRTGVLFIDLDDFKTLNDRYGHDAGDRFLIEFGRRLEASTRPDDICARYGGDEFLVIGAFRNDAEARALQARLTAALAGRYQFDERVVDYGGPSIGVAVAETPNAAVGDLIARADTAMYARKQARREQGSRVSAN